jgi:hypothetical protein
MIMGFLIRWALAFVLVSVTYNPSPWNFVRWAVVHWSDKMSVTVLFALVLLIAYIIYLRATLRSIGGFGMGLVLAVFGALVWVFADLGLLNLSNPTLTTWLGILALSLVMGIGLSWSLIRRRISGQADMDDVSE